MAWKEQKFLLNNIMKIKTILTLILVIIPFNVYGNFLKLNTPAKQVILYDHELKKILFEKNSNDFMKPASMAKIMTAYIEFDRLQEGSLNLDDTFKKVTISLIKQSNNIKETPNMTLIKFIKEI